MNRLGMEGKLYYNAGSYATPDWKELKNVKDVTLTLEKGEADLTTRGNAGWKATVGTLKEGSIEFEMVWDTEDAGFTALQNAWFGDTPVEMAVMDGPIATSGSQGLRATMSVISFSRKEPLEEAMSVSVTIKPTYAEHAPEWMKVT
ncbi:MAG TPA: phage tail tube protein [Planctomycetota bacterium]|nr:phage tail tube protein [Planctomycetota bacterium]